VLADQREQAPRLGYAFEVVLAAILEPKVRACNEILDRVRHEHLARVGERCDACPYRDCDTGDLAVGDFALAGMQTGPDCDFELAERVADCGSGADGTSGAIECSEESIAGRINLPALEARELAADEAVMPLE
jgi:hypothetical protein